jgi:hypothetical protein
VSIFWKRFWNKRKDQSEETILSLSNQNQYVSLWCYAGREL